jgi:hypothetical protein
MKKAIPSRLLELKNTQGEYVKFFSKLNSSSKKLNVFEILEEANKIKNVLVRFGCMVSVFGETAQQQKDEKITAWASELFEHAGVTLDCYVTGGLEISDVSSFCDLMYESTKLKDLVESE